MAVRFRNCNCNPADYAQAKRPVAAATPSPCFPFSAILPKTQKPYFLPHAVHASGSTWPYVGHPHVYCPLPPSCPE